MSKIENLLGAEFQDMLIRGQGTSDKDWEVDWEVDWSRTGNEGSGVVGGEVGTLFLLWKRQPTSDNHFVDCRLLFREHLY